MGHRQLTLKMQLTLKLFENFFVLTTEVRINSCEIYCWYSDLLDIIHLLLQDSVGPNNLPGYAAVQNLAEFLITLVDGNLTLTQHQLANIIRLWDALSANDKSRTNFQERHDPRRYHKFRAPKTAKHPGVQSLEW